MTILANNLSTLISHQVPDFIREDHPNFLNFIKAYYEWLEDSAEGKVLYHSKKLLDYVDVDRTSTEFINYFTREFLPNFPETILADKSKLIKHINAYYKKKGTPESLKFLFRVIYGEDIEVFYPKENILKASDGKWLIPRAFKISVDPNVDFDLEDIVGRKAIGSSSQASCIVSKGIKTLDSGTNFQIYEIFVTDIVRHFENGEYLYILDGVNNIIYSGTILGAISNVKIDPNNKGLRYEVGDPVVISGGLSEDNPVKAVAQVGNVSLGRIETVTLTNGGYGYTMYPNTLFSIVRNTNDTTGSGADVRVSEIDAANSSTIYVNTDAIDDFKNLQISATTYGFPHNTAATAAATLGNSLQYNLLTVYPIKEVSVVNRGSRYSYTPSIDVRSYYETDFSGNYQSANWVAARQTISDIGKIIHVDVVYGGQNYNPSTDTITIVGSGVGNGYGAEFSFTVSDGTITSVTVVSGGEGYRDLNFVINSTNGTGAVLRGYVYGGGADGNVSVDKIGQILDFRVVSRGSGYISTPTVSLKVADMTIDLDTTEVCDYVYQGTRLDPTFIAKIDSIIEYGTQPKIRIFDYSGDIHQYEELKFENNGDVSYTANLVSLQVYGNGLAKASAIYTNGLIEYNGFFLNTDGFLSSDKRIQDSKKYHNFSYAILSEKNLTDYRQMLLDIFHPAGTKLLGYKQLLNTLTTNVDSSSNTYVSPITIGTVSTDATDDEGGVDIVHGTNTTFISDANVGDMIVIDYGIPVNILNRGYGYRKYANTITTLSNDNSLAFVAGIKSDEVINLEVNVDAIFNNKDVQIGASYSLIAGTFNQSSSLSSALTFETIEIGPISRIWVEDIGDGTATPRVQVDSYYSTDHSGYMSVAPDTNNSTWVANRQNILNLGKIAHVEVLDGGSGYSGSDTIYVSNYLNGYGASFTINVDGDGVITSVGVTNSGHAYFGEITLGITTSTGSGASFRVYLYGEGFDGRVNTISSRQKTKRITNISYDDRLTMESSISYIGDGRISLQDGNNKIIISGNNDILNLQQDDIIKVNVGSIYAFTLSNISNGIATISPVSTITANNIIYEVYPYISDVNYKIVSIG